jgi:heat shock protein HtpX
MYEQIRHNRRASWLLMGFVVALLAALGFVIGAAVVGGTRGGLGLLGVFGVAAIAWSVLGYYSGDKMVLAVSGAHQVTHENEAQLFNVVEEMTIAAGLPNVPAVYVIEEPALNAFATGRDPQHSSIAVTRGLIQRLDREELQGVVAHEMSHIRNYDIRFTLIVGVMVGSIALLAQLFLRYTFWFGGGRRSNNDSNSGGGGLAAVLFIVGIVLAILAPIFTALVQMAVSRQREYLADASSVELTRNPHGLESALAKLAADSEPLHSANGATQHLYIVNPLKKLGGGSALFSTHPPIVDRINRLRQLTGDAPMDPSEVRQLTGLE